MKWLQIEKNKSVYNITLNRPDVRNAFNPEMIAEVTHTFRNIPKGVKIVVLRGQGSVFCSGADLEWMRSMVNFTLEQNQADSVQLFEMFQAIRDCSAPVMSVVQGAAMGGALGIIACSDVVLAEEKTQFCFSEVRLGLAPAVISQFILEKLSVAQVAPWMISGKVFGVLEALHMGLVHIDTKAETLEAEAKSWIQGFLDASPVAVAETRQLVRTLTGKQALDSKHITTSLISKLRVSEEGQEGLKAFLEKRKPAWKETLP